MNAIASTRGDLKHKIWAMTSEATEEFLHNTFFVRIETVGSALD